MISISMATADRASTVSMLSLKSRPDVITTGPRRRRQARNGLHRCGRKVISTWSFAEWESAGVTVRRLLYRSEERRVGKVCRSWKWSGHWEIKKHDQHLSF